MFKNTFKKLSIIALSAACVMALASCGTGASAETAAETAETSAETAAEKAAAREDVTRAEWSLGDIEALSEVVTGITDREYAAGGGAAYKIYEDVTYDRGIVYTVLFNTASVRFDTPGTYDMTYWVYFDAAALKAWADENGVSLDVPDTGRLAVWVPATVAVTEAEDEDAEDAEDDAAGADEDTASGASGDESASAGAGSGSNSGSGSLKGTASDSSSCSHVWEEAYDADRDVDFLVCSRCGATKAVSASSGSSTGASSGSSKSSGSGSSSKSTASGSSKSSSSASCSHNWVDEGHYESVLVQAAYDERGEGHDYVVCNNCGYEGTDANDVIGHTQHVCNCGYHVVTRYETVHHDAVYKTQWVSSYKCSKCGATK